MITELFSDTLQKEIRTGNVCSTFEFIRSKEGSKAVFQSYHGSPKPSGDTRDNKPVQGKIQRHKVDATTVLFRLHH